MSDCEIVIGQLHQTRYRVILANTHNKVTVKFHTDTMQHSYEWTNAQINHQLQITSGHTHTHTDA